MIGNACSLSQRFGPMQVEFLLDFDRKTPHGSIVEIARQARFFVRTLTVDLGTLALDVAVVLDLNLDLTGGTRVSYFQRRRA